MIFYFPVDFIAYTFSLGRYMIVVLSFVQYIYGLTHAIIFHCCMRCFHDYEIPVIIPNQGYDVKYGVEDFTL